MGAGGALGGVSAGGVAERDGGGARDHLGEAAEADARCARDAGARAQAGDRRAEGAACGTSVEEKLILPLVRLDSRRSLHVGRRGVPPAILFYGLRVKAADSKPANRGLPVESVDHLVYSHLRRG